MAEIKQKADDGPESEEDPYNAFRQSQRGRFGSQSMTSLRGLGGGPAGSFNVVEGSDGAALCSSGGLLRGMKSTKPLESALGKMSETRKEDQKNIRERAERLKQFREQRYERLLEEVLSQDDLKCNVSNMLRNHSQEEYKKQAKMYGEWNEKIYGRLQDQTNQHLNPPERGLQQRLWGSKSVDFRLPNWEFRPRVSEAVDPAKRQLYKSGQEEAFRRSAEHIILTSGRTPGKMDQSPGGLGLLPLPGVMPSPKEQSFDPNLLVEEEQNPDLRARSRPVLDPNEWGQIRFQATTYGFFAQAAEADVIGMRKKQLKMGNGVFVPSEKDGVSTAGKRRTRFERNNFGVLQGEFAQRGESIQFKQNMGGGSGAPVQDHFLYETGTKVTDTEFPLGKKIFKHMH